MKHNKNLIILFFSAVDELIDIHDDLEDGELPNESIRKRAENTLNLLEDYRKGTDMPDLQYNEWQDYEDG